MAARLRAVLNALQVQDLSLMRPACPRRAALPAGPGRRPAVRTGGARRREPRGTAAWGHGDHATGAAADDHAPGVGGEGEQVAAAPAQGVRDGAQIAIGSLCRARQAAVPLAPAILCWAPQGPARAGRCLCYSSISARKVSLKEVQATPGVTGNMAWMRVPPHRRNLTFIRF